MKDPAVKRMKHRKRIKNSNGNQSLRGCCEGWESPAAPRPTLFPVENQALGLLPPLISEKPCDLASRSVQPHREKPTTRPKAQAVSQGCITRRGKARAETGTKLGSLCWDSLESWTLHDGLGKLWEKQSLKGIVLRERSSSMNFVLYFICEKQHSSGF